MSAGVIDVLTGSGTGAIQQIVDSPEFEPVLKKIEDRARIAVIEETKHNAVSLIAVAVAAGAVSGALMPRGVIGAVLGGALGWWAVNRMLGPKTAAQSQPATKTLNGVPSHRMVEHIALDGMPFHGWDRNR